MSNQAPRGKKRGITDSFSITRPSISNASAAPPAEAGGSREPAAAASAAEERAGGDYEKIRKRCFIPKWKKEFTWLAFSEEEGTMSCTVCIDFSGTADKKGPFFIGTNNFRKQMIQAHAKSRNHLQCVEARRVANVADNQQRTIPGCVQPLQNERDQMCKLFTTAYFIVKEELSFKKFKAVVALQVKNGVQLGSMYNNDNACRRFIHYLHEDVMDPVIEDIRKAKYTSILVDSSTDSSNQDLELMYLRYLKHGVPVNVLVGMKELEHANAHGHLAALEAGMNDLHIDDWRRSVVGLGTDGAAVIVEKDKGLAALLREQIPWLCNSHCMTHRLELGVMDAIKDERDMQKVLAMLEGMYKTFKSNPKSWRELRAVAELLDKKAHKPGNLLGTRWMPHVRPALLNVMGKYETIVAQFENMLEQRSGSAVMQGRARQSLKLLKDDKILMFVHLILDIVEALSRLSLKLQEDSLTLADALRSLSSTSLTLTAMKSSPGQHLESLLGEIQDSSYRGVHLGTCNEKGQEEFDRLRTRVVDKVLENLVERFESMQSSKVLSSSSIIDVRNWPVDDDEALATYGNGALHVICTHFAEVLEANGCNINVARHVEWFELKQHVKVVPQQQWKHIWQDTMQDPVSSETFSNILHVIEIIMVLPPLSTAACERGFSLMKRTKSDWRSGLTVDMLLKLMSLSLHGPAVEHFDATGAVARWLKAGNRHFASHSQ